MLQFVWQQKHNKICLRREVCVHVCEPLSGFFSSPLTSTHLPLFSTSNMAWTSSRLESPAQYFPLFSCTNQYGGDTGQWGGGKKSQVSTLSAYLGILRRCSPCKPCSPDFVDVPWNLANLIPVAVKLQPLVLGSQFCEFTNTGPCALFLCFFSFEQELCRGLCFSLTFCGSIAVGILPCLSCFLGILGENPKWSIFVKGTELS